MDAATSSDHGDTATPGPGQSTYTILRIPAVPPPEGRAPYVPRVMSTSPCHVCGVETRTRCSGCRALAICSLACQKQSWPAHKLECKQFQIGMRNAMRAGVVVGESKNGACTAAITPEQWSLYLAGNDEASAIYDKYGITDPPGLDSPLSAEQKVAFFIEMLQLFDSGAERNKALPLPIKTMWNRRYNNAQKHMAEHFTEEELSLLNVEMQRLQIGDHYRSLAAGRPAAAKGKGKAGRRR